MNTPLVSRDFCSSAANAPVKAAVKGSGRGMVNARMLNMNLPHFEVTRILHEQIPSPRLRLMQCNNTIFICLIRGRCRFFPVGDQVVPIVDWLELANDAVMIQATGVCCCRKSQLAGDSFRVAKGSRRFRWSESSSVLYWSESWPESVPQRAAAQSPERSAK